MIDNRNNNTTCAISGNNVFLSLVNVKRHLNTIGSSLWRAARGGEPAREHIVKDKTMHTLDYP